MTGVQSTLHGAVVAHLRAQGLDVDDDPRRGVATFRIDNPSGAFEVRCTSASDGVLVVHADYPHPIDTIDAERVAELVTRANSTMRLGSLDLDLDTASVRFRSATDFTTTEPSSEMIAATIGIAVAGMVRWIPPIASVAAGLPVDLALSVADVDP